MNSIELLAQDPFDEDQHLYREINERLADDALVSMRVAMAYASWGGLSLVAQSLEAFLDRKGTFCSIFGVGNGITTSDALCYAHYLHTKFGEQTESYGFSWDYCDSAFHSKLLEFIYPDRSTIVVGSANLTNGGLAANHELALSVTVPLDDNTVGAAEGVWQGYLQRSTTIDPAFIRKMASKSVLGQEGGDDKRTGKRIGLALERAKKPLFAHILEGDAPRKVKHGTLSETSTLSEKPAKLYLEILGETGGGHQVQLPVATLGTFFGVGEGESRDVSFSFYGGDEVNVQLTHFGNNTHRVRLRPIKSLPRPSVLVFERTAEDEYFVQVVPKRDYRRVIRTRCNEQTRAGSRRWGFE